MLTLISKSQQEGFWLDRKTRLPRRVHTPLGLDEMASSGKVPEIKPPQARLVVRSGALRQDPLIREPLLGTMRSPGHADSQAAFPFVTPPSPVLCGRLTRLRSTQWKDGQRAWAKGFVFQKTLPAAEVRRFFTSPRAGVNADTPLCPPTPTG